MSKLTDALQKMNCYSGNIEEFTADLNQTITVIDENDGNPDKLVLQIEDFGKLLQTAWDAVKETMQECEGKKIEIRLPETFAGNIIKFGLNLIGFKF